MSSIAVIDAFQAAQPSLVDIFQTIDGQSCPYRYNFHLHTCCSDGQLPPEALMEQATMLKLEGLAITDHHSIEGYQAAAQWLQHQPVDQVLPHLWIGVEITARLAQTEVHVLAYGFEAETPALQPYLQGHRVEGELGQAESVINAIHRSGGLAVLAHPVRYRKSPEDLTVAAVALGIDGLETYYCYKSNDPWRPSPVQTRLVQQLAEQYDLLQTCGTDTHGLDIQQRR
ncbi:5'-3' exoribonuclease [Acaryochloris thomasi RCC1774]|uniref:5'-3' exoribonuclease n=1 Tax=Acaryochloris thomasi RCC1774 TaxID=1764569 RepID=A0A2W1JBG1_9CYAN|nr:PHP domain-containing protein [Acaryochloris thomasi]PZD71288.1 5'-3' exoribonuclease [Acaryochloris thomasi RCC1774]